MTQDQANREIEYLFGLFPKTQLAQLDYWRNRFEHYDQPRVRAAVQRCFPAEYLNSEKLGDFLDISESERRERARRERIAADQRAAQLEVQRQRAAEQLAADNAALDSLSDAELAVLKRRATDSVADKPWAWAKFNQCDPRQSTMLRSLMAEILRSGILREAEPSNV